MNTQTKTKDLPIDFAGEEPAAHADLIDRLLQVASYAIGIVAIVCMVMIVLTWVSVVVVL